jgi:predicted RNA-binding protein with PUA-like domain
MSLLQLHHNIWVFLADPNEFGWNDLVRAGVTVWDGITNAQAQRYIAQCASGDVVLIYHTAPDKALVGLARVASGPRREAKQENRVVVDVEPVKPLARPIRLAELKSDEVLKDLPFVRMPRVAVQPLTNHQFLRVLEVSGTAR